VTRRVAVRVKPGSKTTGIEQDAQGLLLRVRERAVEGAANEACIRALAEHFKLAPSRITLVRGAHSRQKLFDIDE